MRNLHPLPLLSVLALTFGSACSDGVATPDLRIDRVVPAEVSPGRPVRLQGGDFGAEAGSVAIGGRPVRVLRWAPGEVEALVPADQARGQSLVVLTTAARGRTNAAPLTVLGAGQRPDPERRFPDRGPGRDLGPPRDGGPPPLDDGPPPPPDMEPLALVAEFTPDPGGSDAVSLVPVEAPQGFLRLQVRVPRMLVPLTSGIALHLAYDANLLALAETDPREGRAFIAREIGPGRTALVRVSPEQVACTLTFRLVGRGEARIDLPSRHRALRDQRNADLTDLRWAGGSVRVQAVAP